MPEARPRDLEAHDVLIIVGKRGTGKSTEAKALIAALLELGKRVTAFDLHDEYSQEGRATNQVVLGPLRDRCTVEDLERDPGMLDDAELSLAVVASRSPEKAARDFESWADLVMSTGNLIAVADEVGFYSEFCQSKVKELATQSRHCGDDGVPVVFVAQRMTQIPLTARSQASRLVSFRQDSPPDLAAIGDLAGHEFAEGVARLPIGEAEVWRDSIPLKREKGTDK